jgi:hypothetical protein
MEHTPIHYVAHVSAIAISIVDSEPSAMKSGLVGRKDGIWPMPEFSLSFRGIHV